MLSVAWVRRKRQETLSGETDSGQPEQKRLYCGRHDYGTRILKRAGNLAADMRTMGHKDVKTAMQYQHPELEIVRAALDQDAQLRNGRSRIELRHTLRHT